MAQVWVAAGVAWVVGCAGGAICTLQRLPFPKENTTADVSPPAPELHVAPMPKSASEPQPQPEPELRPEQVAAAEMRKAIKARWKVHRKHHRLPLGQPQVNSYGTALPQVHWDCASEETESSITLFEQLDVENTGTECRTVRRDVICREALGWLREQHTLQGHVITSLPDIGELDSQTIGNAKGDRVDNYREWFVGAVALILNRLAPHAVAVFYQSDGRHMGTWLDKSYLCQRAAEQEGCHLLYHKIALFDSDLAALGRSQGKGRPQYSHMIAFSHTPCTAQKWFDAAATPDIFPRGEMIWKSAMGEAACVAACLLVRAAAKAAQARIGADKMQQRSSRGNSNDPVYASKSPDLPGMPSPYLRRGAAAAVVIDPFCGQGTVLAVANELGMDALGVELSRKRCRQALKIRLLQAELAPGLLR